MKFNSIGQLSKHREKFCVGSYMPYQDKPYILREWNLADDKIRQLNAIKVRLNNILTQYKTEFFKIGRAHV